MLNLLIRLRALTRNDRGQDLIEYALLAGLIALGSVMLMGDAGDAVEGIWTGIVDALGTADTP
jgi:Flp pilus assembly pilin Flp